MTKLFNNILVPLDYSDASELAVEKSIDIANHFKCDIHLLFAEIDGLLIRQPGQLTRSLKGSPADGEARLFQVKNKYQSLLEPGLQMHCAIRRGNRNRVVSDYALRQQIDLLIIGRHPGIAGKMLHKSFNINAITSRVDCPVLTVRDATSHEAWMNIVLPICSALPIRKIMFASYLARKYNSRIHLLAIAGHDQNEDAERNQYLLKAYQLLRDNTNLDVECHTVRGHNIADTTLRFAQKINADLIVVDQDQETRFSGLANKLFKGFLYNESKIPVMTISRSAITG